MRLSVFLSALLFALATTGSAIAQTKVGPLYLDIRGNKANFAFNPATRRSYVPGFTSQPNGVQDFGVNVVDMTGSDDTALVPLPSWLGTTGSLVRFRSAYDDQGGWVYAGRGDDIAVNPATNRIYIPGFATDNETVFAWYVAVMDGATNAFTLIQLPTWWVNDFGLDGFKPFGGVTVNPNTNRIYIPGGDSGGHFFMVIINGETQAVELLPLPSWPDEVGIDYFNPFGPIAVNPQTNHIYSPGADASGHFYVADLDGATNAVVLMPMPTWDDPVVGTNRLSPFTNIAVNAITNRILMTGSDDTGHFYLTAVDGTTRSVSKTALPTWDVPGYGTARFFPTGLAVDPTTNRVYMPGWADTGHTHMVIADLSTDTLRVTLTDSFSITSRNPVVDPVSNRLYQLAWWAEAFIDALWVVDLDTSPVPAGLNVSVVTDSASLSFDSVTGGGSISVTSISDPASAGQVSGGFAISDRFAFEVAPSASLAFSGLATICFQTPGIDDPDEFAHLRVLHMESGMLIDRTSNHDFLSRKICALTPSFSPFYVTRVGNQVKVLFDQSRAYRAGSTIPIRVQMMNQTGANISSSSLQLATRMLTATGTATNLAVLDAGNANPDSAFRYDAGLAGYIFNLSTKGLAPGRYVLSFWAGSNRTFFYTAAFEVR